MHTNVQVRVLTNLNQFSINYLTLLRNIVGCFIVTVLIAFLVSIWALSFVWHRWQNFHLLRSNKEVFVATFGKDPGAALRIIRVKDALVPIMDADIEIEFLGNAIVAKQVLTKYPWHFQGQALVDSNQLKLDLQQAGLTRKDTLLHYQYTDTLQSGASDLWMSQDSSFYYYRSWW